jgi:3-(3-hydroxy-phenyl)propionate hydroxylase
MYDVAIVGAGPTGVVAASLCAVHGLSAIAVDRERDVYELPRAVGMWDDVQRILHDAGVLDAVVPDTIVHEGAEFVDVTGARIIGIDIPPGFLTANGHPPIRGFHQPTFERAVRACLARHETVALRLGCETVAAEQTPDGVSLAVHDRATGETGTVRARWLLGCDGAASVVRKACGIGWHSLGYDREWLVVDVRLERDVGLPRRSMQVCDPARPTTLVPVPLGMHRWEFQLLEGETREEMERPERVRALLAPWVGPDDAEIVRAVVYRFHATIAETFRSGRVFLAGDAAHQTPPFMGQGMCSGVRDVHNLVWKLAHARRGEADDALLDTYTAERHPMAVATVRHSVGTGRAIDAYAAMAAGGPPPPPELEAYAYGGAAALPELSTGLLAPDGGRWVGRMVPLCTATAAGRRGPFDDVVGPRWAIVGTRDPRASMGETTRAGWEALGAAFVTVPEPAGAISGLLAEHDAAVVRPDRIVYAVTDRATDLDALGLPPLRKDASR